MKSDIPALVLLLAWASPAFPQLPGETRPNKEQDWMAPHSMSWTIAGSFGLSHGGSFTREFGSVVLGVERVMSGVVGRGFLAGKLTAGLEILPAFAMSQETTTFGVGFNLLGRHYLEARGPLRPFITAGAGMLVSNHEIPTGTTRLNFTPQLGAGIVFSGSRRHQVRLEYRFHHLSNGGRVHPNPGINSSLFQLSVEL